MHGSCHYNAADGCRSLGDALRQWEANLSIAKEAATPKQDETQQGAGDSTKDGQQQDQESGRGEYEFMGADEGRAEGETQALAPATEDQARALEPLDQPALPEQDADDITAAAEQEAEEPMTDAERQTRPEQVLKGNTGSQTAAGIQEEAKANDKTQGASDADTVPAEDISMADADAAREGVDDSYVSAQLQRASLSDRGAGGLPDEDMVLGEGGLTQEAAEQLRKDVDMRIKAASEGILQLGTSDTTAAYGQEVSVMQGLQHGVMGTCQH